MIKSVYKKQFILTTQANLRSDSFSSLDLGQKRNLKNIALTWVTLEKQLVCYFTQLYSFLDILWQEPHFLKRLYTTVHHV